MPLEKSPPEDGGGPTWLSNEGYCHGLSLLRSRAILHDGACAFASSVYPRSKTGWYQVAFRFLN